MSQILNKPIDLGAPPIDNRKHCLHKLCTECHGTGRKEKDGTICVHYISCPCEKCTPSYRASRGHVL